MEEDVSLHLVESDGPGPNQVAKALAGLDPSVHDSVDEFAAAAGDGKCVVVVDVDAGADCNRLLGLCREVAERDREWTVLLAEDAGDDLAFRPVSLGFELGPDEVAELLEAEAEGPPFELHEVLRFVARIRHDINNPLTAGMAETQLLLMDLGGEGEVGESLETIERQLQRIQALVQDLARLRRPSRDDS